MRIKLFVVAMTTCLSMHAAHADEATTRARQHYERATSLYDVGRFADAAEEYEAAYQVKNDPALLYNLGQAYRYAGEYDKAIFAYRGYLRRVPDASNRGEVEGFILKSQQQLAAKQAATAKPAAPSPPTPEPAAPKPTLTPPQPQPAATTNALTAALPPKKKPVYKQWWLWTTVGVVAAGAGVGLYFALTTASGTKTTPVFPAIGNQP